MLPTAPHSTGQTTGSKAAPPRSSKGTILLLEDEVEAARLLTDFLQLEGFVVRPAANGHAALAVLRDELDTLSLAILDVMVPGPDGRAVLQHIRQSRRPTLPVILLTARDQESDEIMGLRLGADDYITKPASLHRIKARLDTLLRRSSTSAGGQRVRLGALELDRAGHSLILSGHDIAITLSEFKLLELLLEQPGATRTRQELLAALPHESDKFIFDRTVDAHIKNLRAKLPTIDLLIITVRGVGYRINPEFTR